MRILVAVALALSCFLAQAVAADWPQWRGPNRDGAAPSSPMLRSALPADGLMPTWVTEKLPNGGWGCPIVADGRVYQFIHHRVQLKPGPLPQRKYPYLADDKRGHLTPAQYEEYEKNRRIEDREISTYFEFKEELFCFDAATGATIWRNTQPSVYSRFVQSGTPALAGGKLYILGAARHARCIEAATGKDVWNVVLPGEFTDEFFASSFAVVDGTAVVLCGSLFGLDAPTGKLLWEGDPKKTKSQHTSPVVWHVNDRSFVIANVDGATACFEPKTGQELWRVKSEASQSTPVLIGDRMLTYGNSRRSGLRCYVISSTGAEEAWQYRGAADKGSSPVVVGKNVYVQGEKRLACVSLETGDEQWNTTLDLATPQYTSLIAADGKVIYALDGLLCFAAQADEFKPLMIAKFGKDGLMADEAAFRRKLKLNEVEAKENGLEESLKIYQREVGNQGPIPCTSPAIADGRLYLRLRDKVACYDLRADTTASTAR